MGFCERHFFLQMWCELGGVIYIEGQQRQVGDTRVSLSFAIIKNYAARHGVQRNRQRASSRCGCVLAPPSNRPRPELIGELSIVRVALRSHTSALDQPEDSCCLSERGRDVFSLV
jgi:hypothetical protein